MQHFFSLRVLRRATGIPLQRSRISRVLVHPSAFSAADANAKASWRYQGSIRIKRFAAHLYPASNSFSGTFLGMSGILPRVTSRRV